MNSKISPEPLFNLSILNQLSFCTFTIKQYELPQLKEYCEKILVQFCTVQNALEIVQYAKLYNLVEATGEIQNYIAE
jgi:hypothetical protein